MSDDRVIRIPSNQAGLNTSAAPKPSAKKPPAKRGATPKKTRRQA